MISKTSYLFQQPFLGMCFAEIPQSYLVFVVERHLFQFSPTLGIEETLQNRGLGLEDDFPLRVQVSVATTPDLFYPTT